MKALTGKPVSLIGMIHVRALPGTPAAILSPREIVDEALREAEILATAGFDGLLIENMHDVPYLNRLAGPEIVAGMTAVACAIRREFDLPLGIQILAGANKEALAVAHAAGARFIRAEGFVYAHIADEGLMESDAGELLRYRRAIGADDVLIAADIKKKHSSHAITADVSLDEMAHTAEFFGADALVITGTMTGRPANRDDLRACGEGSSLPRIVGSGVSAENIAQYLPLAQGLIIGSSIKQDGQWFNPIDPEKARALVGIAKG